MKTKEFVKRIEDLGFVVKEEENFLFVEGTSVLTFEGEFLKGKRYAVIKNNEQYLFYLLETVENLSYDKRKKLIDIIVEYSYTPVKERKEPKKYYLRLPLPFQGFKPIFLYYNQKTKQYLIDDDLFPAHSDQDQFTQEEIDAMPNQEFIKTLIKEEVKE